jgi:hypothetical protein
MKRSSFGIGVIALVAALLPLQASGSSAHHSDAPDQINLPNGWQPEGITTDGKYLFVGSLVNGAIFQADAKTGAGRVLSPGAPGRVAAGVEFDKRRDLLWVAGGPTGKVRAHDADTGRVVARYSFPSATPRFLNDLVATRCAVYATDSFNQELAVVPLKANNRHDGDRGHRGDGCNSRGNDRQARHHDGGHGNGLPPASAARTLPLTGDIVFQDGFNLNGIVESHGMLLAVQSNTGKLFRINPRTGNTKQVNLGGTSLQDGDGLELDGDILYAVRNENLVVVIELNDNLARGRQQAVLTDSNLDVTTTAALARHSLWVVNARFLPNPTPDDPYWVTRLDEFDD